MRSLLRAAICMAAVPIVTGLLSVAPAPAEVLTVDSCQVLPDPAHPAGRRLVEVVGNRGETVAAGTTLRVTVYYTDVNLRYVVPPATSPPVRSLTLDMTLVGELASGREEEIGKLAIAYPVTTCKATYESKRPAMAPRAPVNTPTPASEFPTGPGTGAGGPPVTGKPVPVRQ